MKIVLVDKIPDNIDVPFGTYEYDEVLSKHPKYIDIRGIVREKCGAWVDEIQESHAVVSSRFLRHTRWWWVTSMSRLQILPSGTDYLFKPFLFAKGVLECINAHPEWNVILLVACDKLVGVYLSEFDEGLLLEWSRKRRERLPEFFKYCFQSGVAVLKMLVTGYRIVCHHMIRKMPEVENKVLILHEFVRGSIGSGYKYFYGSLIDSSIGDESEDLCYCCTCVCLPNMRESVADDLGNISKVYLLDNMRLNELLKSMLANIFIILTTWLVGYSSISCSVENTESKTFWRRYLFFELGRIACLNDLCCYWCLKSLLKESKSKLVVTPYEEKGRQRAIVMACHEHDTKVIGYSPHPMSRFLLALRDGSIAESPKPDRYGVSGLACVDNFVDWGNKDHNSIRVWGSGKGWGESRGVQKICRSNLKVLLLISHPNELRVFHSWLRSEKRLSSSVTYYIRVYKAVGPNAFECALKPIMMQFGCVNKTVGSLTEDLSLCDVAAFCATSAGPLAVKHGCLSIYVDLNDFLEINPCFDEMNSMLPCKSSQEFANRLDAICDMDEQTLMQLQENQKMMADRLFGPVQDSVVREDLSC